MASFADYEAKKDTIQKMLDIVSSIRGAFGAAGVAVDNYAEYANATDPDLVAYMDVVLTSGQIADIDGAATHLANMRASLTTYYLDLLNGT
jgi:hypothetical protein